MHILKPQSYAHKLQKLFLCPNHGNYKMDCDLDRNHNNKKNRAPDSTADKDSSVYDIVASANISTMEILNRVNNGSKHELSLFLGFVFG